MRSDLVNVELQREHLLDESEWEPSALVMKLASDHTSAVPSLGAERAIHYTEYYKRNTETSAAMTKAGALAWHLQQRTLNIHEDELIVGSHTEHRIGAICHVELAGYAMLEDLFRFEKRKVNPLHVDPAAKRKLMRSVIPYWLTRNLAMKAFPLRERMKYLASQSKAKEFTINEAGGIAHFLPDYGTIITLGTEGLRALIDTRLSDPGLSESQREQLAANLIALGALETFADRYRDLAQEQGRADVVELLTNVPRQPASSLHEAVQMIWFFQMVIQIESIDQGISLGRMDQYLYPLYLREKASGRFDERHFKDVFCAFCLKLSEVIPLFSERITPMFSGLPNGQALTIGGCDSDGNDASNELTFMLLDVLDKFKTRQPNWHARLSSKSRVDYSQRVFEVIAGGGGSPALYNDDVIIPSLASRFDAKQHLWNYATVGCVEPALSGISFSSRYAAIFNSALVLETVLLRDVLKPRSKNAKSICTMDELIGAIESELRCQVGRLKTWLDGIERANKDRHPVPFSSMTVKGCIERARDLTDGGADYNASGIQAVGLADLGNSLAAIDTLVFDSKEMTLETLALACKNNFAQEPSLKARLTAMAKFGNDDARVDNYTGQMVTLFDQVISEKVNTRGGRWMPGVYSMTCHQTMGKQMSALPSGRSKGEPLADGIAPTDGSDCLGPTAALNSVARLDHSRLANGINLNLKFDANTVKGTKGPLLLGGLTKGYFTQGGMQVQINVLDPAVLMAARMTPEKYRNLLVRVSGYSAYFVDLTPEMQDEIIARTRQGAG